MQGAVAEDPLVVLLIIRFRSRRPGLDGLGKLRQEIACAGKGFALRLLAQNQVIAGIFRILVQGACPGIAAGSGAGINGVNAVRCLITDESGNRVSSDTVSIIIQ